MQRHLGILVGIAMLASAWPAEARRPFKYSSPTHAIDNTGNPKYAVGPRGAAFSYLGARAAVVGAKGPTNAGLKWQTANGETAFVNLGGHKYAGTCNAGGCLYTDGVHSCFVDPSGKTTCM